LVSHHRQLTGYQQAVATLVHKEVLPIHWRHRTDPESEPAVALAVLAPNQIPDKYFDYLGPIASVRWVNKRYWCCVQTDDQRAWVSMPKFISHFLRTVTPPPREADHFGILEALCEANRVPTTGDIADTRRNELLDRLAVVPTDDVLGQVVPGCWVGQDDSEDQQGSQDN
jgi:hypothetical protein